MRELTQIALKQKLIYSESTGIFIWAVSCGQSKKGDHAGSVSKGVYMRICVNGSRHYSHRLAWFYVYGVWPEGEIDHINGDGRDNRISNLRVVSRSENEQNTRSAQKNSVSGILGIAPHGKAWRAQIRVGGNSIHLGTFRAMEDAHSAYLDAKRNLHSTCTI